MTPTAPPGAPPPATRPPRLLRSMGVLGGGTVAAAVLGLLFQSLLAYWFGAGAETDAWFMSLSIFAFLAKFLMLTHLKSLTLPLYARLRGEDPAAADALAGGMFRLSVVALGVLTGVLLLAAPLLVDLLAPGYDGAMRELTVTLVRIRVPGLLFLGAITVGMAVLESRDRFGVTISAQKLVPAAVALGLLVAVGNRLGIVAVGWIGLAGTVAGACVVLVAARRFLRAAPPLSVAARDPAVRRVGRQWMSFSGSNLATLLGEWAFRVGASLLPVGLFSAVLYGRMVHDLLHGAVNDAAQTASLPRFARLVAAREGEAPGEGMRRLGSGLREGMAGLAALNLPLALYVAMTAPWIVALLFGRGRFLDDGMVGPASVALALFAAGFVLQGLVQLVFAAAFASHRGALVNRVQIVGHLVRAAALVPLVSAFSYVGLVGAQVGMNVLVLGLLLAWAPSAWRLHRNPAVVRALVAAAPAPLLHALLVAPRLPDPLAVGGPERFGVLALLACGWAAVTVAAALLAGVPGLRPLLANLVPGHRSAVAALLVATVAAAAPAASAQAPLPVPSTGAVEAPVSWPSPDPGNPAAPDRAAPLQPAVGPTFSGPAAALPTAAGPTIPGAPLVLPAAPLPDHHWALDVLEWLEARGALAAGTSAFRPLPADRVEALLRGATDGVGGLVAAGALGRFLAEAWGPGRGTLSGGVGGTMADGVRARATVDGAAGAGLAYGWLSASAGEGTGAVRRAGAGVRLGPVDVALGRERLTLGGGGTGAMAVNATAPVDGLMVHTPEPVDLPVVGGLRVAFGLGPVASYESVDGPWLGVLRVTAAPVSWLQLGLSRGALAGGRSEGGPVPYDPVPQSPDDGSLSAVDVLRIFAGKNTGFDDQVVAVDARVALAPLGVPALAYAEMGWEDADRSWGDPGLLAGLLLAPRMDVPVTLRYEYAAFGGAARLCRWCDTLPAFWYRHKRFQDGWRAGGELLAHPLGGYGLQHRVAATAWRPDLGVRLGLRLDRLRRDRWNLLFDERPGHAWAAGADASWRWSRRLEARAGWSREWGGERAGPERWSVHLHYLPDRPGP